MEGAPEKTLWAKLKILLLAHQKAIAAGLIAGLTEYLTASVVTWKTVVAAAIGAGVVAWKSNDQDAVDEVYGPPAHGH